MNTLFILLFLITSLFSGLLSARPIVHTVIADGKEWSQADIFVELSWDEIKAVCPAGVCGEGTLNGYDMKGWRWATIDDFESLIQSYGYGGFYYGVPFEYYSTWVPSFFAAGFRQTGEKLLNRSFSAYLSTELPPEYEDSDPNETQVYFPHLRDVNEEAHLSLFGEIQYEDGIFLHFGPHKYASHRWGALFYYDSSTAPRSGQVTLSPSSGAFVSEQEFDLVVIVDASYAITKASIAFDGIDVAKSLASCWQVGALPSGGFSYRCPGIKAKNLGVGKHQFDIRLYFSDGSSAADSVTWVVSDSTTKASLITDTVTVNGREWAQVALFNDLAWSEINQVCAGSCGAETLNGYYMEGWTWAGDDDVLALGNHYLGADWLVSESKRGAYSEANSAWAPRFFNDGWRSTGKSMRDVYMHSPRFHEYECPEHTCRSISGLTSAFNIDAWPGQTTRYWPGVLTVSDSVLSDKPDYFRYWEMEDLEWRIGNSQYPREIGAWFYRDTPGAPLPEAPSHLIISPGSGKFVTAQVFDLTVRLESPHEVSAARLLYDGADVAAQLSSCWTSRPIASSGQSYTCSVMASHLGLGTHTFEVSVDLDNGDTVSDRVIWEVLETAE